MKHIKNFNSFCNESELPNIKIDINDILNPLKDKIDLFTTFEFNPDEFNLKNNLSDLYNNANFNKQIIKKKLKKGKLESTKDNQTLLSDNYILTFFFIYDKNSIEIEEPKFILLQYYDKTKKQLSEIMVFKNHKNINDFYQKLTDSTIEITKGNKTYIYNTSNSGNNWELRNANLVKGKFKDDLDIDQMNDLLKDRKIKINK